MAVARGDEGGSNVTASDQLGSGNRPPPHDSQTVTRRRARRDRVPSGPRRCRHRRRPRRRRLLRSPPHRPPPPGSTTSIACPMPKLFAFAEKEGIIEHTGMNRGQLIIGIVRRQIERGLIVRGSGTLEVLPDGYGFLRSSAHNYLASPGRHLRLARARSAASASRPAWSSKARSACRSKARTTSPSCRSISSTA